MTRRRDADRIIVGNTRPQGDGFIGGNWRLLRMIPESGGAESRPASPDLGVNAGRAADIIWAAVVMDGNTDEATQVTAARSYELAFGRFIAGNGAPWVDADIQLPAEEDTLSATAARPDLVYLQPTFGDHVWARLSDVGDLQAGEYVWLFYKFTNRQS